MMSSVKLDNGNEWAVGSGIIGSDPVIIIPVSQIDNMTTQEIGEAVLKSVRDARLCSAKETALSLQSVDLKRAETSDLYGWLRALDEFTLDDPSIQDAFFRVHDETLDRRSAEQKKERRKQQRQVIAREYDRLFVAIGRRDGFECAECHSTGTDLQIDHKIPVAADGPNNLGNLQLLCARCNRKKSDSLGG